MARIADMQRQQDAKIEPDGVGFDDTPLGKQLTKLRVAAERQQKSLKACGLSASYDPKNPPSDEG